MDLNDVVVVEINGGDRCDVQQWRSPDVRVLRLQEGVRLRARGGEAVRLRVRGGEAVR